MIDGATKYFLAGLAAILPSGCLQAEPGDKAAVNEITSSICKQVPAGASSSQVVAFLDAKKVEHSDYREQEKTIFAIVRNTSGNWLVTGAAQIEFHFDENVKVKDCTVKEVFTGP
jgi:CRISPR/Cas system CMR-associated protein Cmr5 small subunit